MGEFRRMKSNQEWKAWGKADPLFAVASWKGREKDGTNPWTETEFYELGRSDWADFFDQWQSYGVNTGHCVEIGCGTGRLTQPLSEVFESVTALDVSKDQIAYAKSRLSRPNVSFVETDGVSFADVIPPASAVFSIHVFQHFDAMEDAERVFREAFRAMSPGGTLMIHLPISILPSTPLTPLVRMLFGMLKCVGNVRANIARKRGKLIMRGLTYERSEVANCLETTGFCRVEFRAFRLRSNQAWHDVVLAEKPSK
jgi:ubiquinone/menaquinone biosynthesis C-methylase UbiE